MTYDERFFDRLPAFTEFAGVAERGNYTPLPEDWVLAVADIVGSTKAIAAGRYKAVNMAGASVISAVMNVLGHRDMPFVFGGDGALVAIPSSAIDKTRLALAAVQTWVSEELDLTLRAAMVPMTDIRKAGQPVTPAAVRDRLSKDAYAGVVTTYKSDGKGNMAHEAEIVCFNGTSRVPVLAARYSSPPG